VTKRSRTARQWDAATRQHDLLVQAHTEGREGRPYAPVTDFLPAGTRNWCSGHHSADVACDDARPPLFPPAGPASTERNPS
jgi:hypothetical protein